MPLLLCPNDNGPMQTVERSGVQFDMCPTCRGVWLDRGELEKLMVDGRQAQDHQPPSPWPRQARDDHGRPYDPRHHKKKRGFDLFDIFD